MKEVLNLMKEKYLNVSQVSFGIQTIPDCNRLPLANNQINGDYFFDFPEPAKGLIPTEKSRPPLFNFTLPNPTPLNGILK